MYWWHLENLNEGKMLHKFLSAQKNKPVKNDWILQVEKDKQELRIDATDEELLKMSKGVFKNYIRKKVKNAALEHLNKLKRKHTKVRYIESDELKCSQYLMNSKFTSSEAKNLFKFRTHMYSVKENFENLHRNMLCDLCYVSNCSQSHLFQCPIIRAFVPEIEVKGIKYEFIFGKTNEMKLVANILEKICKIREVVPEVI